MSASTSLHSAHLAEMVEISTFDYGFKVTTSSTEMAEIAEIDPLQLTEQGTALPGLYTGLNLSPGGLEVLS